MPLSTRFLPYNSKNNNTVSVVIPFQSQLQHSIPQKNLGCLVNQDSWINHHSVSLVTNSQCNNRQHLALHIYIAPRDILLPQRDLLVQLLHHLEYHHFLGYPCRVIDCLNVHHHHRWNSWALMVSQSIEGPSLMHATVELDRAYLRQSYLGFSQKTLM